MKLFVMFYWVIVLNGQPISNCNYQVINNIIVME